ncbi:MAG: sodium:solute symporter family protein [Ignavibacteriae bacterium]|nr:sodium:solute symporter family protein [Ignavibacteriota bacterium]
MNLSIVDLIVIAVYFLAVIVIGFFSYKLSSQNKNKKTEFLLAGRQLTLPLFVATLVATWYGLILGVGEFVYSQGVVAWVCMGLPYYCAATLFGIFVAGKVRKSKAETIPEQVSIHYGAEAGRIASILVLIITIPAAYILMLGILLQMITGMGLPICIIIGTLASILYLFTGGFRADVTTNALQFFLMYIGFGVLLIFAIMKYGSIPMMISSLPESHITLSGGNSWQVILTWFIISLQTFIDPSFHQRSAAAKTPAIAKKGILISVLFWVLFDFLTITTGLYAQVHLKIDPIMAFPALGENILPVFWKGIFVVSLLATVMSTLNSYSFISGMTIGNDIISKIIKKNRSTEYYTRIGLGITSIIGIVMAIILPSAVQLIYKTASIAVPGLLIPLLSSFSQKRILTPFAAICIMVASSLLSGIWTLLSVVTILPEVFHVYLCSIEPMIPGIVLSTMLFGIFAVDHRIGNANMD